MVEEQKGKAAEEGTRTEVVAKAKRRQHPAEYKLRILREIDEFRVCHDEGIIPRAVTNCAFLQGGKRNL